MEKGLTKSAIALSLAMFLFGGVAGFFVGYPVGRDASIDLFPTADVEAAGGMTLGEGTNDGIGMTAATIQEENYEEYGIMPIAESAQQVTATVTPAGAEDAVIDWAVTWKSGASGQWGNGKAVTDYVTVTPTSDGALTASVSCLQAFGEQIILTASIRGNESVKGTATVDYVQKFESSLSIKYTNTYRPDLNTTWNLSTKKGNMNQLVDFSLNNINSLEEAESYYSLEGTQKGQYEVAVSNQFEDVYTIKAEITDVKLIAIGAPNMNAYGIYNPSNAEVKEGLGSLVKLLNTEYASWVGFGVNATISGFNFFQFFRFDALQSIDLELFKKNVSEKDFIKSIELPFGIVSTVNGIEVKETARFKVNPESIVLTASNVSVAPGAVEF